MELSSASAAQVMAPSVSLEVRYHGEKYKTAPGLFSYSYPEKNSTAALPLVSTFTFIVTAKGFGPPVWERAQRVLPDAEEERKMSGLVNEICRAFAARETKTIMEFAKVRSRAMADSLGMKQKDFEAGFGGSLEQLLQDKNAQFKPCQPQGLKFTPLADGKLFRALSVDGENPVAVTSGPGMRASYEIYISRFSGKWVWVR